MNIMHVGINMGIEQITSKTLNVEDHLDTLEEVDEACEVALEVLNDLLMYDKLENGRAKLKKEEVNTLDFISNNLKTFSVLKQCNAIIS